MRISVERVVAAVVGLIVGYLVWLAALSTATFVVPPRYLVAAGVIVVIALIVAAATLAIRFSRRGREAVSLAFWVAPIGPVVASSYSLIVLVN
jgi:uncharacterized protein YacL